MSEKAPESLLDEPLQEIAEEAAAEKDANPKVIENVLTETPDPLDAETEKEAVEHMKPDYFPEKFWTEKDGPDLEKFSKSYAEMEKKKTFHKENIKLLKMVMILNLQRKKASPMMMLY